jgi:hypothetical protein
MVVTKERKVPNYPWTNDETGLDDFDQPIDDEEERVYNIVRFHKDGPSEVIEVRVTLDEAMEHCKRPDTTGDGWFDGWRKVEDAGE